MGFRHLKEPALKDKGRASLGAVDMLRKRGGGGGAFQAAAPERPVRLPAGVGRDSDARSRNGRHSKASAIPSEKQNSLRSSIMKVLHIGRCDVQRVAGDHEVVRLLVYDSMVHYPARSSQELIPFSTRR